MTDMVQVRTQMEMFTMETCKKDVHAKMTLADGTVYAGNWKEDKQD